MNDKEEKKEKYVCQICKKTHWRVVCRSGRTRRFCTACLNERRSATTKKSNEERKTKEPKKNTHCVYCSSRPVEGQYCDDECRKMSDKFREHIRNGDFWK
jgi:hypothetical protein